MDGPPGSVAVSLALLIVLSAVTAGIGAATPGTLFGVQSVDPDQVYLDVDIEADGDAQWRIEYRVRLDSQNETEAFQDLTRDVEQNESAYLTDFTSRIRGTVDAAENSTGREMTASNFTVDAEIKQIPQQYGVLTYTFDWSNFAVVEDDRLTAGDALAGFFLDSETTLSIGWPTDYRATTVTPEPTDTQDNAVVWRGPLDFGDGEPRVVVEPDPTSGTTTSTTDGGAGTTSPGDGTGQGLGTGTTIAIVVVLLLIGGAGFLYLRRSGLPGGGPAWLPTGGGSAGGSGGGSGSGGGTGSGGGVGGGGDTAGGAADDAGTAAAAGREGGSASSAGTPEELLSNEERVIQYLEESGGRAKQQEIVDGLGWTDAKTSQVLSGMASDDQIEKFRIGRENVVKLPDGDDSLGPTE